MFLVVGNNGYAKFWAVNKVHYGVCENGECRHFKVLSDDRAAARQSFFFLFFTSCVQIFESSDEYRLTQNQSKLKTF